MNALKSWTSVSHRHLNTTCICGSETVERVSKLHTLITHLQANERKVCLAVFTNGFLSPPSDNVEIRVSSLFSTKHGRPTADCEAKIITWDEKEVKRWSRKNHKCVQKKSVDTVSRLDLRLHRDSPKAGKTMFSLPLINSIDCPETFWA